MSSIFLQSIKSFHDELLKKIDDLLPNGSGEINDSLKTAMRYTVFAPSKCIRPFLFYSCSKLFQVSFSKDVALTIAAAIEFAHVSTIIHDDMECMDNEEIRRGVPALHKVHGEGVALLTGNALLLFAFELIASSGVSSDISSKMIVVLSRALGYSGVIGGQSADISHSADNAGDILTIHGMKTASFFTSICVLGGIFVGASSIDLKKLDEYGRRLGLAFQIKDDVNDAGMFEMNNLARLIGKEEACERANVLLHDSMHALNMLPGNKSTLYSLVDFVKDY